MNPKRTYCIDKFLPISPISPIFPIFPIFAISPISPISPISHLATVLLGKRLPQLCSDLHMVKHTAYLRCRVGQHSKSFIIRRLPI